MGVFIIVVLVGVAVGFINTVAGSGSLISLPLLIFLGLPPTIANGTNRVGILMQSAVAVFMFKKKKIFEFSESYVYTIPALIGSLVGAYWASELTDIIMKYIIGGLLIIMFFLLIFKTEDSISKTDVVKKDNPTWLKIAIFSAIGFYGGFIQAGIGFFLLAGLIFVGGFNLLKSNALKVLIVGIFTPFVLVFFIINQQVDFKIGLLLGLGNMIGAYLASKLAIKKGMNFIRYILIITILLSALKLFGFFEFIFQFLNFEI